MTQPTILYLVLLAIVATLPARFGLRLGVLCLALLALAYVALPYFGLPAGSLTCEDGPDGFACSYINDWVGLLDWLDGPELAGAAVGMIAALGLSVLLRNSAGLRMTTGVGRGFDRVLQVFIGVCLAAAMFGLAAWHWRGVPGGASLHVWLGVGGVIAAGVLTLGIRALVAGAAGFALSLIALLSYSHWIYPQNIVEEAQQIAGASPYCLADGADLTPLDSAQDLSLLTVDKVRQLPSPNFSFRSWRAALTLAVQADDPEFAPSNGLAISDWDLFDQAFVPFQSDHDRQSYVVYALGCLPSSDWLEQDRPLNSIEAILETHRLTIPARYHPQFGVRQMTISATAPRFEPGEDTPREDRSVQNAVYVNTGSIARSALDVFPSHMDEIDWSEIEVGRYGLRTIFPEGRVESYNVSLDSAGGNLTAIQCTEDAQNGAMCLHRMSFGSEDPAQRLSIVMEYPSHALEDWQQIEADVLDLLAGFGLER